MVDQWVKAHRGKLCEASSPSALVGGLLHTQLSINKALLHLEKHGPTIEASIISTLSAIMESENGDKSALESLKFSNLLPKLRARYASQTAEITKLSKEWDSKFAKPKYCKSFSPVLNNHRRTHNHSSGPNENK